MPKDIKLMSDAELVSAWKKGRIWLVENMEDKYPDHASLVLFLTGLTRIQNIEDELQQRGVKYGY